MAGVRFGMKQRMSAGARRVDGGAVRAALGLGVTLVALGATRHVSAHPVYAGGEDNGVRILSHGNTDFKSVDGSAGGKVRTFQDFDAQGAMMHKGVDVATVDDLTAAVAILNATIAALTNRTKYLESVAPPACVAEGTRGSMLEYNRETGYWVCNCLPGWTGNDCSVDERASLKVFADRTELVHAVRACSGEDPTCAKCYKTEATYGLFENWNISAVTDLSEVFADMHYFNGDVSHWDTSNVVNMDHTFAGASAFNRDISGWDTGKVKDMGYMFHTSSTFNQDIGNWTTSSVTDMKAMFEHAVEFNQDISSWDVSSVTDMKYMFKQTEAFWQDISAWSPAAGVETTYMWLYSNTAKNSACDANSGPSCTAGIK